jgi:hypothetical protein
MQIAGLYHRGRLSRTGGVLGRAAGWLVAPLFGVVSFVRQARTFHPRGPIFHARVERHPDASAQRWALADRLAGQALVRFSGALWKRTESVPDVLGCAIRLRRNDSERVEAEQDDQDLLFATIRRPWTMLLSPLTTNVHDYLANDYFAVSPFDVDEEQRVYLRLHPTAPQRGERDDGSRAQRLTKAMKKGRVALELSLGERPFGPWAPLASITLERAATVDGESLRFRPFRTGRGVRPRGFVHGLRAGVYALSQRTRPARKGASARSSP